MKFNFVRLSEHSSSTAIDSSTYMANKEQLEDIKRIVHTHSEDYEDFRRKYIRNDAEWCAIPVEVSDRNEDSITFFYYKCSNCGYELDDNGELHNFCPCCGSYMGDNEFFG